MVQFTETYVYRLLNLQSLYPLVTSFSFILFYIILFIYWSTDSRLVHLVQIWKHLSHEIQICIAGVIRHSFPKPLGWFKPLFSTESTQGYIWSDGGFVNEDF